MATGVNIGWQETNQQIDTLGALWEIMRNAFIKALLPQIDNEINIRSVDTVKKKK